MIHTVIGQRERTEAMPITVQTLIIPTYSEPNYETLPMFCENRVHQRSGGNPYPNAVVNATHNGISEEKPYTAILLENDYVSFTILPELGGRIFRAVDKRNGYDFFYRQSVIKPALIGALGSWISGGVEFNWPYHHRPSTFLPVDYTTETEDDGTMAVHLSEDDPFDRMKGMVTLRLSPDSMVLETAARIFNGTSRRNSFLWWENAAVPVHEDYRIFFPGDVRHVYFHYRRNAASYPIGSGFYNGHDFGDAVELTRHGNIRFATSLFSDNSAYDFFGGYDCRRDCGVIHTANRHTSPGKKLFTWGYGQLSEAWEAALTDTDGAYAELMASSYSSNQPDFSWIEPYETKCFSQYWYPLKNTGIPFYADRTLILSKKDGSFLLSATKDALDVKVIIRHDGAEIGCYDCHLSCLENTLLSIGHPDPAQCEIEVFCGDRRLLRYVPVEAVDTEPTTIGDLSLPEECETAEAAYRTGIHMLQYKDPKGDPTVYFRRALALDETHIQARTALAEILIKRKDDTAAQTYLLEAERLLTKWNRRPESGKVFYLLGCCAEAMEQYEDAQEWYWQAAVLSDTAGCAYTRIAALDGLLGDVDAMAENASYAAARFPDNLCARAYAAVAAIRRGELDRAKEIVSAIRKTDPLFHLADRLAVQLGLLSEDDFWSGLHSSPSQTSIDLYEEFCTIGMRECGEAVLSECIRRGYADAMVYLLLGQKAQAPIGRTFPCRLCEKKALEHRPDDPTARYLLGCLLYHDRKYSDAAALWETLDTSDAKRNLAIWHWHEGRTTEAVALLTSALTEDHTPQLLWEWANTANRCGMYDSVIARLSEEDPVTVRDDILLEWVHACNRSGANEEAYRLMMLHRFVPCEGGESAVTSRYIEAAYAIAQNLYQQGAYEEAMAAFDTALTLPMNLGAGLWNDGPSAPSLFGKAMTLRHLGRKEDAEAALRMILSIKADFFSDMHQPLLPIWQACALKALGLGDQAEALYLETLKKFQTEKEKKDSGYFTTTPFFNCYIDPPAQARQDHFTALLKQAALIYNTAF